MNGLKTVSSWAWVCLALVMLCGWQQIELGRVRTDFAEYQRDVEQSATVAAEAHVQALQEAERARVVLADRLAELDITKTQELSDALEKNDRLQRDYAAADSERKRLRIEVKVARSDATLHQTVGAGGMGNAASVELSDTAGRAVWDLRRSMISDREKIDYLQGYIRRLGLVISPPEWLVRGPSCRR